MADFDFDEGRWMEWWPIHDDSLSMRNLIGEATPELLADVKKRGIVLSGKVEWRVCPGSEVKGAGSYELILVADCPVLVVSDG